MGNRKILAFALLAALAGCSEAPKPAAETAEPAPPPVPVDGQKAFFQAYVAARSWASDAQGLRLESVDIPEVKSEDGKYGAWRATFVSPAKQRVAIFNYAVAHSSDKFPKGVFQDHEEGYGRAEKPWPVSALKTSSEKVLQTALERKEAKDYMKKNPDKRVAMLLEQTNRHPNLAWRVVWGESISRSDFSIFVDASSGAFLEVMR
ncbi:MAG: hypothetical protein KIT09_27980 [Bryobacteraceae bacterium]|nr:hypothetical protein [Bryobacteraceae bacterium]